VATRRRRGEHSVSFEHIGGACRDPERHRSCPGRWVGQISLGYHPSGSRKRKRVTGKTKTIVQDRLKELERDLESGVEQRAYTVRQTIDDWLEQGRDGRSPATVRRDRALFYRRDGQGNEALRPEFARLGGLKLRELTARQVQQALSALADSRSTATISLIHNCLTRAIQRAEKHDLVRRNVARLVDTPTGKRKGRPSKSLTLQQAQELLRALKGTRMEAYIVLSLVTGTRTEEIRALRWTDVDFDGDPNGSPPVPPHIDVWRSVRAHGDTKTEKSRRTLALPQIAVDALRAHQLTQAEAGVKAGNRWEESYVFATATGTAMDSANVRRDFRAVLAKVDGIDPKDWTPRELRHSFVSMLSDSGVAIEEIARLAGHSNSRTTEVLYRKQLRPVLQTGAIVMDDIFSSDTPGEDAGRREEG
jgi:integrase